MIRLMREADIGVVSNYLQDEFIDMPNVQQQVLSLVYDIKSTDNKYVLEVDGLILGFYAYKEVTPYTAYLISVYITNGYRSSKHCRALWKHAAINLKDYQLVKCKTMHDSQKMPAKYYNKQRKIFDVKKVYERLS